MIRDSDCPSREEEPMRSIEEVGLSETNCVVVLFGLLMALEFA